MACMAINGYTQPPGFADQLVTGGFNKPEGLTFADNGLIYVWDKPGIVYIVENGVKLANPLIDISEEVANHNDLGLSGFALDPDFTTNGHYYLLYNVDRYYLYNYGTPGYNANQNNYKEASIARLTRYTADPATGFKTTLANSRLVLIGDSIADGIPVISPSHSVGSLVFMLDKTLMISVGDGYSGSQPSINYSAQALNDGIIDSAEAALERYRAQYPGTHQGKILRIDPASGEGVSSNPLYDIANPRSPDSRMWAMGFRNPFRMVYLPGTGDHNPTLGDPGYLLVGDVGQNDKEELNIIRTGGQNFGWPVFEGVDTNFTNLAAVPFNINYPTPAGCAQPYYTFADMISNNGNWPDPCNPLSQLSPAIYQLYTHSKPALDYRHGTAESNITQNGTVYPMGAGNPSLGAAIEGTCAMGGWFYEGNDFPPLYRDVYYHVDFSDGWIKAVRLDANYDPDSVYNFVQNGPSIVSMAASPTEPGLFYIDYYSKEVRKIVYAPANLPPTAVAEADTTWGPGPLTVQFDASNSTDPDNDPLTYAWDFGDGSPVNTNINPSHTFTPPNTDPIKYTVFLTVTDDDFESHTDSVIISVNNSPPVIVSTSMDNVNSFSMTGTTPVPLSATVTDAEHSQNELFYTWVTSLHHSDHNHPEPEDTSKVTLTELTPIGCDGVLYFYRITLIVTDAAGLSDTTWKDVYPDCGGPIGQTDITFFTPGMSTVINVLNNDIAGPAPLDPGSVVIIDLPDEGTVTVNPVNGFITYDYTGGPDSADQFSYQFMDSLGNLSPVTLVSLTRGSPGIVLPGEKISLQAEKEGRKVHLTWFDPEFEYASDFGVERSADGILFREIIHSHSHKSSVSHETDHLPPGGDSYYRIKRTGIDGTFSYSNIVSVNFPYQPGMVLSPNPTGADSRITVSYYQEQTGETDLTIWSVSGKEIQRYFFPGKQGENIESMRIPNLEAGIYLIRLNTPQASYYQKLMVK